MSSRDLILTNIRGEIRVHLRKGKPLPERDPRWAADIAIIMEQEKRELERDQIIEVEEMYQNYFKKNISGLTYEEWLDKAKKLYRVDGFFVVHSIALGPDHGKQWICKDLKDAHKKVLKLIAYKRFDHFVRGHDFAYDPDEEVLQTTEPDNK